MNIYAQYPQIDDAKLNSLMKIYADAANKHSNIYSYWRSKLDTAIHNENKTDIKLALDKCIKHRILSNDCFVCHSFRIERAYLALGEIDNAIALRDDIIADRIPKESKNIFTNCSSGTLYEQNINLLISAVCLGMPEMFFNYAEETFDASPVNGDDNVAYLLICAYLGHYEDTERALLYIMGFENDKHFPFTLMLGALCICTYLSGMVSHGYNVKKIPLCRQNSMFHGEDSQECSVSSAIEYFSAIADNIGRRFEKSRKAFNYDRLKNTIEIISHGKIAN